MNKSHHARHPAPVDPDVVRAEAAALRALYERYKAEQLANGVRVSQERFGDDHGIGSQGMVWQYLEGKRAVGLEAAERFARAFGVPIFAFSPRLAEIARRVGAVAGAPGSPVEHETLDAALLLIRSLISNDPGARERARDILAVLQRAPVSDAEVERRMPITKPKRNKDQDSHE